MVDILSKLRMLINDGNLEEGLTARKISYNSSPISSADLEKLYIEKREAISLLSKNGNQINYKNIAKSIDLNSINSKFHKWKPVKNILTLAKYGNLIK